MANVTDAAFRRIIAKYGKPDLIWTEFVSAEGLLSAGRERLLVDFWFDRGEHPIVAQIFGGKPEQFYEVAQLINKLGFDGTDINMGCPDKGVEKSGGGAALIKNPKLAQEIIAETIRGAGGLPVSVKTRLGYNKNELDTWLPALLDTELSAVTLHLRTRKEMSFVPAHWEEAGHAVEIRDKMKSKALLLGNGDVQTPAEAREKAKQYGVDGVMLGRAIFGNPWLFAEKVPAIEEKLKVMVEHAKLFEKLFGTGTAPNGKHLKPFEVMKKHFKAYCSGFDGAKELRVKLMETENVDEVEKLVIKYLTGGGR